MSERIHKDQFIKILKKVFPTNAEHRQHLLKVFENDLIDGLTEFEIKSKLNHIKYDTKDQIDMWKAEKAKKMLLEALGK